MARVEMPTRSRAAHQLPISAAGYLAAGRPANQRPQKRGGTIPGALVGCSGRRRAPTRHPWRIGTVTTAAPWLAVATAAPPPPCLQLVGSWRRGEGRNGMSEILRRYSLPSAGGWGSAAAVGGAAQRRRGRRPPGRGGRDRRAAARWRVRRKEAAGGSGLAAATSVAAHQKGQLGGQAVHDTWVLALAVANGQRHA